MTFQELLGLGLVLGLIGVIALLVASSRLPVGLKRLIYAALAFRVIGAFLRYRILIDVYDRTGDALGYYERGLRYAQYFWRLDFSPFYDRTLWMGGEWTKTAFVPFPSAIVLTMIGPSLLGEFVFFSLLSFGGLVGFAVAFRRMYPDIPLQRYARWIWLFPSLWFWPSSVGKEALILMGIGMAVAGYIGKRDRIQWPILFVGIFFVFVIRPQVAAIVIVSLMLAHWLSFGQRWTFSKALQGATILAVGLAGIWLAMGSMGVEDFGVEGVQEYMLANQAQSIEGSTVERVGIGVEGVPMAMVNILTRPWPWEATNSMSLLSAMEMVTLWGIVLYRRKNLMRALRHWRSHALLRVAVPFVLLYSISLGMLIVNLGIIARQRVFIFPFLFLLLEAVPATRKRRVPVRSRRPLPHPMQPAAPHSYVRDPA